MVQFFSGSSLQQDGRYSDKDKKLMNSMKFPSIFSKEVNINKVNLEAFKPWISQTTTSMLGGYEDEILNNLIINLLKEPSVDPKMIQIQLTPFLEEKASKFMEVLWQLLIQAESSPIGIPPTLVELFKKTVVIDRDHLPKEKSENPGLHRNCYSLDKKKDYFSSR